MIDCFTGFLSSILHVICMQDICSRSAVRASDTLTRSFVHYKFVTYRYLTDWLKTAGYIGTHVSLLKAYDDDIVSLQSPLSLLNQLTALPHSAVVDEQPGRRAGNSRRLDRDSLSDSVSGWRNWIEQCFTSPPAQSRLYGRRFLQVKRPNQQYQSTEGKVYDKKESWWRGIAGCLKGRPCSSELHTCRESIRITKKLHSQSLTIRLIKSSNVLRHIYPLSSEQPNFCSLQNLNH